MLMALALVPGPWDLVHAQAPPSQTIRSADASDPAEVYVSARHSFRVVTVVEGLDLPWSMAWLPSGEMLVTERPGRLRIIRDGKLEPEPITGWPRV
jgi:glucose/arabinose dehydrogenase